MFFISFTSLKINSFILTSGDKWFLKSEGEKWHHHCHKERLHSFSHDRLIKKFRRHCHASTVRQEISSQVHSWDQKGEHQALHMHETPSKMSCWRRYSTKQVDLLHILWHMHWVHCFMTELQHAHFQHTQSVQGGLLQMMKERAWKDVFVLLMQSHALSLRHTQRRDALHNSSCKGPPSCFTTSSSLHWSSSEAV